MRKNTYRVLRATSSTSLFLFTLLFASTSALAFTGYGDGSTEKPYYISSCDQLQQMADDLDGSYKIVRNIDCNGYTFSPVGVAVDPFTGTLNGQGFTIKNLTISSGSDDIGLFGSTSNATISNLKIVDFNITGGAHTGTIVGTSGSSHFSDIRIEGAEVTGTDNVSSFIGQVGGGTINRVSSIGITVQGTSSQIGGLVGSVSGGALIQDAFAEGSVSSGSNFIGGLIGHMDSGPVQTLNTYSNVTVNSTGQHVGGLVGYTTGSGGQALNNSFSASSLGVGTTESSTGAAVGTSNSTSLNLWFDDGVSSWDSCVGDGSVDCTAANSDNLSPNYFKNNNTVAPLDEWDFEDVWVAVPGEYPMLKTLTNTATTSAPNGNDANGNGTNDSYEGNVNSVQNGSGVWSTITIPSNNGCSVESPSYTTNPTDNSGYTHLTSSLTGFRLYCNTAGASVPVTIIFDKIYDTNKLTLRYYDVTSSSYKTITGATFSTVTIGGIAKTTATYNVTDGGSYDSDDAVNGIIIDPVGLATAPDTLASTGYNQDIIIWISLILIISPVIYAGRRRKV